MRRVSFPADAAAACRRASRPFASPPVRLWLMLVSFFGPGWWRTALLNGCGGPSVSVTAASHSDDEPPESVTEVRRLWSDVDFLHRHETPFSLAWMKNLVDGEPGCGDRWRTVGYHWRREAGVVGNLNNVLETWVYAIVGRQRDDVAIVDEFGILDGVACNKASNGEAESGMSCIWTPIPHLCYFRSQEEWENFMRSRGATELDIQSATDLTFESVDRSMRENAEDWLREYKVDHFAARHVLSKFFLWGHLQPWLKEDVRSLLASSPNEVKQSPFVALRVAERRDNQITGRTGDGAVAGASHLRRPVASIEAYLSAARHHVQLQLELQDDEAIVELPLVKLEDIRGVWVSSEDPAVFEEVKRLAPLYFPGVGKGGSAGGTGGGGVYGWAGKKAEEKHHRGHLSEYRSIVYAFADLIHLSRAHIMVGSINDGVDDVATLVRAGNGKPRESSVSVDIL